MDTVTTECRICRVGGATRPVLKRERNGYRHVVGYVHEGCYQNRERRNRAKMWRKRAAAWEAVGQQKMFE